MFPAPHGGWVVEVLPRAYPTAWPYACVPASQKCVQDRATPTPPGELAVRREFLDLVPFWNARDLEWKLADFQVYYNAARSQASLGGHTPLSFASGTRWLVPS
jgi:hypothetical protein